MSWNKWERARLPSEELAALEKAVEILKEDLPIMLDQCVAEYWWGRTPGILPGAEYVNSLKVILIRPVSLGNFLHQLSHECVHLNDPIVQKMEKHAEKISRRTGLSAEFVFDLLKFRSEMYADAYSRKYLYQFIRKLFQRGVKFPYRQLLKPNVSQSPDVLYVQCGFHEIEDPRERALIDKAIEMRKRELERLEARNARTLLPINRKRN